MIFVRYKLSYLEYSYYISFESVLKAADFVAFQHERGREAEIWPEGRVPTKAELKGKL